MQNWHTIPNASDHLKWYQNKGKLKLNFFLSVIFLGMVLNGYDSSLIAGLQASDAWQEDLDHPTGARLGMLNAVSNIAGLVVGPVIAYIDEHWGRRWGIRFYGFTMLAGSIIGCIAGVSKANGYALFITSRVIVGFGLASFLMTSLIVVQEITHPRSRAQIAASWNSYWILGSVIAAWVIFGCTGYMTSSWNWRVPYIIQVPWAFYILVAVQFVPETPRFLFSKGRVDEAFDFFVKYHGNGNRDDPLVLFEFEEMKNALQQEKEAKAEKWGTILRSRANRHRLGLAVLMIFLTNLSGSSIIYFYYTTVFDLVGIKTASTQTGINAGLSMFTWLCQLSAVYVGRFVGRRKIILWVWPVLLLGLVGLTTSSGVYANNGSGDTKAGIATVVLVWVFLGTFNFSNPILFSYPAEVQTFSMRSKGLLVWNTVSQLETAYVTWIDAIALHSIGWKYYSVYMPLIIIQWILVYFYMVETYGYTLEEIAYAFDGKGNLAHINILPEIEREQAIEEDLGSDKNGKGE
ncbi:hypothetical protein L204_104782 [Cryptococcus depauperatus]|nr:sugar transporter [Cryptococcus depauperatus CBS 7855]